MIEVLVQHPFAERLGWVLAHSLWQGLLLAVVLLLAFGLVAAGRHAFRHDLAAAVLVVWLALPVVTWFQFVPDAAPVAPSGPAVAEAVSQPDSLFASSGVVMEAGGQSLPGVASSAETILSSGQAAVNGLRDLLPYAALVWLAAASFLLVRYLGGYALVQHLRRTARPLPALEGRLHALAARLGLNRRVRLGESGRVDSPSAMGLFRPLILLPASAVFGLSASQLDLILAHELAHLRRNDYVVSLLQGLAEALLFYHPLTWWLSRVLNAEREHACDELALAATGARRIELAETLVRLEGTRPVLRPALSASGNLRQRIGRLLQPAGKPAGSRPALVPLALIAVFSMWFALADQPGDFALQGTVVIDAGHSLEFPGAAASGLVEAELVLAVSRLVRDVLEEHGVEVRLTRDSERALGASLQEDLDARAALATEDVDAFVSIHAGAANNSVSSGVVAYVARAVQQDSQASEASRSLAEVMVEQIVAATGASSRPLVVQSGFRVLEAVAWDVPAVMLQIGFLTNPAEAADLATPEYQELLAGGIAAGILSHLEALQAESEFTRRAADMSSSAVR